MAQFTAKRVAVRRVPWLCAAFLGAVWLGVALLGAAMLPRGAEAAAPVIAPQEYSQDDSVAAAPVPVVTVTDDEDGDAREPIRLDPAQVDAAHAEVKADKAIQFDLPNVPQPKALPPKKQREVNWDWLKGLTPLLQWLFWIVLGGLVLYLLYAFVPGIRAWVDARLRREAAPADEEDADDWTQERQAARSLLQEAEALAAQGHYAEAVHLLLWRSVEDIEARRPSLIRRHWTSREIANADGLPAAVRDIFATIAAVVEISLFGKRAINAEEWQRCRDAYARFVSGASWRERTA